VTVWTLPVLSQEFRDWPIAKIERSGFTLSFDAETSSGEYVWSHLTFENTLAVRFTGHTACQEDQFDAYDQLVDVTDSAWRRDVENASGLRGLRHFRIYFDDVGCFDIVGSDFFYSGSTNSP
jgi:hypothetical protein